MFPRFWRVRHGDCARYRPTRGLPEKFFSLKFLKNYVSHTKNRKRNNRKCAAERKNGRIGFYEFHKTALLGALRHHSADRARLAVFSRHGDNAAESGRF